jgi:hypothetical protein
VVVEPVPCRDESRSSPDGARPGRGLRGLRLPDLPGHAPAAVLLLAGPAAAFAALAVCLLAAVLVPAGLWRPAVVAPLTVPAAAAVWWLTRSLRRLSAHGRTAIRIPRWATTASLAVAVAFGLWAGLTHGEHLIIRRDAGSYALFAQWLATRHHLPVDSQIAAFGGVAALDVPGFTLASPAYFQVGVPGGADVVPQFLLGAPSLFSLGWWAWGWTGLFTVSALIGGFAILAAAGLVARVAGPRWAPLGALALAGTQPVLHAARATLSEPVALLLVLAAAGLAVDAVDREHDAPGTRRLAVIAGAVLGLAGLVRVDVLREVALAVPVAAVLAVKGHRSGVPLAGAALAGAMLSAVPAWLLSRPYLEAVQSSLRPLATATLALTAASLVATALDVAVRRFRGRPGGSGSTPGPRTAQGPADPRSTGARVRWLPAVVTACVLLTGAVLASRPLWMTVRQDPSDSAVPLIASLQRQQGLPVDGARTYAEQSVQWLLWYTGPAVAVLALVVAATAGGRAVAWLLDRRRGRPPAALVPLVVGLGSVVLTLYRPGITPDHPWADRRLVPVVLPFTVVAATAGAAWALRELRRRRPVAPWAVGAFGIVAAVVLILPAVAATRPLAVQRTEVGQPAAAAAVCAALRPRDAVVAVSDSGGGIRAQNEWVQVVRGVCGRPSAALVASSPAERAASLTRLSSLVSGAGGRLVLLSAAEDDGTAPRALLELGLAPSRAVRLRTTEDQHLLTQRPYALDSVMIDVWLAIWREPGSG